jgi:hypothetical protein
VHVNIFVSGVRKTVVIILKIIGAIVKDTVATKMYTHVVGAHIL